MKWLLYVLAAIVGVCVLAVVVLLAIGGGRGEATFVHSIEIARPASVAFRWLREPERVKSWIAWLVEIRSLTPGQDGVGAREVWVMQDRNNSDRPMNIDTEITHLEPDRVLEARLRVPATFTGTVRYELEPLDAGHTRLTYRSAFKYEHWLAKLFEPLISRSARQKLEEDLARLKQQVEAS
jgi:carbon monoxide dehydrogenase subunit G